MAAAAHGANRQSDLAGSYRREYQGQNGAADAAKSASVGEQAVDGVAGEPLADGGALPPPTPSWSSPRCARSSPIRPCGSAR